MKHNLIIVYKVTLWNPDWTKAEVTSAAVEYNKQISSR
jgi:hypothetical protein